MARRDDDYDDDDIDVRRRGPSADDSNLSAGEIILAILCSGIGCIVGIVYMIQGKPKGGKMLGLSLIVAVIGNIIGFILRAALER